LKGRLPAARQLRRGIVAVFTSIGEIVGLSGKIRLWRQPSPAVRRAQFDYLKARESNVPTTLLTS
jgi:hypothetical protein